MVDCTVFCDTDKAPSTSLTSCNDYRGAKLALRPGFWSRRKADRAHGSTGNTRIRLAAAYGAGGSLRAVRQPAKAVLTDVSDAHTEPLCVERERPLPSPGGR